MANANSQWSIGIYAGKSPFEFVSHPSIQNPVLTHSDVSDVPAQFVADPFMVRAGDTWHMFFEVLNRAVNKGEIGLATSRDGLRWSYQRIVLSEDFHLSYPYVFKHGGSYFMLPETVEARKVQLYLATKFPFQWTPYATLLTDIQAADTTIFFFNMKWWLYTCSTPYRQDTLRLYMADELAGPWMEHPLSPLVEGDVAKARPAGRVIVLPNGPLRYAQDCSPEYGSQVRAFEVTELTPLNYSERESRHSPVLVAGTAGWNSRRMHHLDAHSLADGNWIACVDGDPKQDTTG